MVGRATLHRYLIDRVALGTSGAVAAAEARTAVASSHAGKKRAPSFAALDAVNSGIDGEGQ